MRLDEPPNADLEE